MNRFDHERRTYKIIGRADDWRPSVFFNAADAGMPVPSALPQLLRKSADETTRSKSSGEPSKNLWSFETDGYEGSRQNPFG